MAGECEASAGTLALSCWNGERGRIKILADKCLKGPIMLSVNLNPNKIALLDLWKMMKPCNLL